MKCKFCNAEIEAEDSFCPFCGKENIGQEEEAEIVEIPAEETPVEEVSSEEVSSEEVSSEEPVDEIPVEKPKKNVWMFVAIAACCALAVLLAFVIWQNVKDKLPVGDETTAASTTAPIVYDTYSASTEEVLAAADKVVATIGEYQLTNKMLQIFYWSEFYNFVDYYGNYLSYYGLDYSAPLNEQGVPNSDSSWEQYFVKVGLDSWHRYLVLNLEAEKNGFEMDEEAKTAIEELPANLAASAEQYGFASADELMAADMGDGITVQDYTEYMNLYYTGLQYYNHIYDQMDPTREEVSAYFDENAEAFSTNYGVTKDSGKLVDVRHILLQPEGAETDSTTGHITATDEQWEACRQAAQALLDGWAAGDTTEEAFATLANENSVDGGSNTNGGLYEDVAKGRMVEAFDAWIFEEGRQSGDTGLVKTEYGYHIMYFVETGDDAWYTYARPELISQMAGDALEALMEASPIEVDDDAIVLDSATLNATEETESAETTEPTAATE